MLAEAAGSGGPANTPGIASFSADAAGVIVLATYKDKKYGYPDPFWHWYHRQQKKAGSPPNASRKEAAEEYEEWLRRGKPDAEGHATEDTGDEDSDDEEPPDAGNNSLRMIVPILPIIPFLFGLP